LTETPPLQSVIKKLIQSSGPMPVWRYMDLCLTHPEHGYYVSRDPLGREGDFITAPEVSQMFGELLGLWAASVWKAMGSPPMLQLVELGPGRGTMMADALRALRVLPPLYQALNVHLVEINPVLREKQKAALSGSRPVEWHNSIDEVPKGPAIILANEYFDALPIHQMVKRATGWHERTVEIDHTGKLVFGATPEPTPRFDVLLPPLLRAAPTGAVFEWRPDSEIMKIATRVRDQGGAALIIDYGHVRSDAGDTFQAIARHSFSDPLNNPGQADVTAHVDFQALTRAAEDLGARVHGPVSQGEFLKRLGIETRALTLMAKASHDVSEDISGALNRLIGGGHGGMGSMFKVLAVSEPNLTALAGFADQEPSADEPAIGDRATPALRVQEQPAQEQHAQAQDAGAQDAGADEPPAPDVEADEIEENLS
jgi:SAM-dependent MidA family methyltransferase